MAVFTCRRKLILSVVLINAVAFLVVGITFPLILDAMINSELDERLKIKNGSLAYGFWVTPPVPVQFGIYVFDLKNPEEVLAGTEKPFFVEKGPYVYNMSIHKRNITWHDNGTVSYVQPQKYVYDRDASVGSDNDTFLTLNMPYITVANMIRYQSPIIQQAASLLMSRFYDGPFVRISVHGVWWGYEDPMFEELAKLLKPLGIPPPFPDGKFGFYAGRNNTDDGLYNTFTGLDGNFKHYSLIDRWNGNRSLNMWTTDFANSIRGSDGSQHPPKLTTSDNISMFDSNLMRTLTMLYKGPSSYHGLRTLHFELPFSAFANAKQNPENLGFCTPNRQSCIPSGAYNMSITKDNAPVYVSMPHFLGADPYYLNLVDGLHPDHKKHVPFYDVHALTGVSIQGSRRYQLNIRTQPYEHFSAFKTMPVSYVPVMWIDGGSSMDPGTNEQFNQLQSILDAMPYARGGTFAMSVFFFILFVVLIWYWKRKQKKMKPALFGEIDGESEPLLKDEHRNRINR